MRVTYGGVAFESWPSNLDDAFVIEPGGLTGWFGAQGIRRSETQRPAAHGSFDAPGYRNAKTPQVKGHALAGTMSSLRAKLRQLEALGADGGSERLTVQDDDGHVTWADARVAMPALPVAHGADPSGAFQIGFWVPGAEIYGEERSFTGSSAQVFHRGTIPAPLIVRIASAPAAYTLTSPHGTVTVAGATAGGTHEVDMRTGWVRRNGVLMTGVVTRAETWDVPPGTPTTHSISTGTATWITRDTWP